LLVSGFRRRDWQRSSAVFPCASSVLEELLWLSSACLALQSEEQGYVLSASKKS
jgi:hypothetical protein